MFGWLNLPWRVTNLEKEIKIMAKDILEKIELVRSVVMGRIGALEAHIAELEAKVESGLDKTEILAALASLKAEALGIIPDAPVVEIPDAPVVEPITDEVPPADELTPDDVGVDVGDVEPIE